MTSWKRPSVETKFHIDTDWFPANGKDMRVAVRGQLCRDCQSRFADHRNTEEVDWVDPETAEVERADALLQTLRGDCARKPDFISGSNSLVTNLFRAFLINGNQPMTPVDLARQMPWAGAETILRTLTGGQVFLGLRPATGID